MRLRNLSYRPYNRWQEEAVVVDLFDNNGAWIVTAAFRTEFLLYGTCPYQERQEKSLLQSGRLQTADRLCLLKFIREERNRLYRTGSKSYLSWRDSGLADLEDFCKPGETVDEKIVDNFSRKDGIVRHDYVQDGECWGFGLDENGCHVPLYHTFCKMGGVWVYTGVCRKGDNLCMKTPASKLDICISVLEKN